MSILKSSSILAALALFQRVSGLLVLIFLTRFLDKEDFGIVAIAAFIIALVEVVTATGIQAYIAQKRNLTSEHVNSAWTFDLILKVSAFLVIIISTLFYYFLSSNQSVALVVSILSFTIIMRALVNPGVHVLRKNLDYSAIAKVDIFRKLLSMVVTISLAITTNSYWSLVIGDLVSNIILLLASYRISSFRPKLSLNNLKEQWEFSRWVLSKGVLGYLRSEADIFLVSVKFGLVSVGGYKTTKELTSTPASDIARPIVEPIIASISTELENKRPEHARNIFLGYLLFMSLAVAPIATYIYSNSYEVLTLIFGEKWADFSTVLQYLSIILFSFCINPILGNTMVAYEKIRYMFYYDLYSFILVLLPLALIPIINFDNFVLLRSILAAFSIITLLFLVVTVTKTNIVKAVLAILVPISASYILISNYSPPNSNSLLDLSLIHI